MHLDSFTLVKINYRLEEHCPCSYSMLPQKSSFGWVRNLYMVKITIILSAMILQVKMPKNRDKKFSIGLVKTSEQGSED